MSRKRNNPNKEGRLIFRGTRLEDEFGLYVPVCNFGPHVGVVGYGYYRHCERINCNYYEKFRKMEIDDGK
jgi:hypothetical protein